MARVTLGTNSVPSAASFLFKALDAATLQHDVARFQAAASNVVIRDAVSAVDRAMRVSGMLMGPQEDGSQGMKSLLTAALAWQRIGSNDWAAAHTRLALERAAYMQYSMSRTMGRAEYSHGEMRVNGPEGKRIGDAGFQSTRGAVAFMYRLDGSEYVFHEARTWVQTVREKDRVLEVAPTNTIAWAEFLDVLFLKMRNGSLSVASIKSEPKNVELLAVVDQHVLPVQKFEALVFFVDPQVIACGVRIGGRNVTIAGYSALGILANLCLMNQIGAERDLTDKDAFRQFEQDVKSERDRLFFIPDVVFFPQD